MLRATLVGILLLGGVGRAARAQADTTPPRPVRWYERLSLRGYAQFRYNNLFRTRDDLACAQCDRSLGGNGGFFFRRGRLILSGDVHDRVSIYIQPDLAQSTAGSELNLQIRDLYGDVFLTGDKAWRIRIGQSKVPWGFENLQSSSNRLPLDRNDALNSGIPNERDIGAFVYWAPPAIRQRLRMLVDSGLKGSGDYGAFGIGLYNGQGANRPEANDSRHVVARMSWPFAIGSQILEVGGQFYTGTHTLTARTDGVAGPTDVLDERWAVSAILYPQPFGLQAEWSWGHGPRYDVASGTVRESTLEGGYVQASWRGEVGGLEVIPFVRAQHYDGGKKLELDARSYEVDDLEIGVEWHAARALEVTAMYWFSDRTLADGEAGERRIAGSMLRLQAQLNY